MRGVSGVACLASILASILVVSAAAAQHGVPTSECDLLAAHTADPERVSLGVGFGDLHPAPAIRACEIALADFPDTPRFKFQLARSYQKAQRFAEAAGILQTLADEGYVAAAGNLALLYSNGTGVAQSDAKALEFSRFAATRGYSPAMEMLGNAYEFGRGTTRDLAKAREWFVKSAEAGWAAGARRAGRTFELGIGGDRDYVRARTFYQQAWDLGDVPAAYFLGDIHYFGRGVEPNYLLAASWYRKAADLGHARAAHDVGYMYENGEGLQADAAAARKWYETALQLGDEETAFRLGLLYENGNGVEKDLTAALRLYQRGSNANNRRDGSTRLVLRARAGRFAGSRGGRCLVSQIRRSRIGLDAAAAGLPLRARSWRRIRLAASRPMVRQGRGGWRHMGTKSARVVL
jgi:TPR repeat protein